MALLIYIIVGVIAAFAVGIAAVIIYIARDSRLDLYYVECSAIGPEGWTDAKTYMANSPEDALEQAWQEHRVRRPSIQLCRVYDTHKPGKRLLAQRPTSPASLPTARSVGGSPPGLQR